MLHGIIDIGNTRIKAAIFENGEMIKHKVFLHSTAPAVSNWLEEYEAEHIIVSSTASSHSSVTNSLSTSYIVLSSETSIPLSTEYEMAQLGPDRLANAVAGHLQNPAASLVIDLGSCITYDWTAEGTYLGGGISPGHAMRMRAMHSFTGKLPELDASIPEALIGKNTEQSMHSGAYFGIVGEISHIRDLFLSRYNEGKVLLTGGDCLVFAEALENDIFADPFLTLKGLDAILSHNHD